jgi:GT2 family glycosyltransferase
VEVDMPVSRDAPLASVVIPAYKSADTIAMCLDALVDQETDLPYEVIVVESSGDSAADIIRERSPDVRLIASETRLLGGAARNLGAQHASGELLLFTDSDCVAEKAWLAKMWQAHRDWDCSAVGGSILNGNPETLSSVAGYVAEKSDFFPIGGPRYTDYLDTGNVSYKMEVFRRYGGFDPDATAYQDVLFNKSLSRAGERLLFVPDIKVAHHHRATLREYLAHQMHRGRASVYARQKGMLVGGWWVRHPVLAFAAAPGLFARKAVVFPCRMMRAFPAQAPSLVAVLPCFLLGLLAWHYGFLSGSVSTRKSRGMDGDTLRCTTN